MGNEGRVGMYINNQSCIPFIAFDNCGCFRAAIIIYIFARLPYGAPKRKKENNQNTHLCLSSCQTQKGKMRERK